MGIEYEEIRIKIKNKRTGKILKVVKQIPHISHPVGTEGELYDWKTEDIEIISSEVVYG